MASQNRTIAYVASGLAVAVVGLCVMVGTVTALRNRSTGSPEDPPAAVTTTPTSATDNPSVLRPGDTMPAVTTGAPAPPVVATTEPPPPPPPTEAGGDDSGGDTTGDNVYYKNCAAARAAGAAPLYRGEPGYRSGLDADHDGVACE